MTAACAECGKPLKDPTSKRLGIGPKCWTRVHGASSRAPHAAPAAHEHPNDPNQLALEDIVTEQPAGMTDEELRDYAEHLIHEHSTDIEYLSVFEMYDEYAGDCDATISEPDARKVLDLVAKADVAVAWPEIPTTH